MVQQTEGGRDVNWLLNSHIFQISETKDWFEIYFGRSCLSTSKASLLDSIEQVRKANSFSCSRNEPGFVLENLVKQSNRSLTSPSFTNRHFPPMEQSNSSYSFHHLCSKSLAVDNKGRQELPQLLWCLLNILMRQMFTHSFSEKAYFNDNSLFWHSVPMFWITYYKPVALRDFLPRIRNVFC